MTCSFTRLSAGVPTQLCSGVTRILLLSTALALSGACARAGDAGSGAQVQRQPAVVVEVAPELEPSPMPTAESNPAPEPVGFQPATRGEGSCVVTVHAVLEAQEYRGGGPMTPALEASLAANPEYARMYQSESHGDHHIQCHYDVTLAHLPNQRFRWRTVHNNTLRDLDTQICNADVGKVAQDIVESTKQCADFAAGAYWGYVLEPA